jgi:hypothetical protein
MKTKDLIWIIAIIAVIFFVSKINFSNQASVPGDNRLQLLSSSIVTAQVGAGGEAIVTSQWKSVSGGTFVLEGEIALGSPQSTVAIRSNRCDILAGVAQAWNYRNEKVTFSAGETKIVNFYFKPEATGTFNAYVDALSDCRVYPADIIGLTRVGSFTFGGVCNAGEEQQRDCSSGFKRICFADGTGWGSCVARCNPGSTSTDGCGSGQVKTCFADGTGWGSCTAIEVKCNLPNGAGCYFDENLPGSDDSQPNNECKSGWCNDVTNTIFDWGPGGVCANVPMFKGLEAHPDCRNNPGNTTMYWYIGIGVAVLFFFFIIMR